MLAMSHTILTTQKHIVHDVQEIQYGASTQSSLKPISWQMPHVSILTTSTSDSLTNTIERTST